MKMSGERIIPAPQVRVWEALNDPEVLRQSIPGCEEIVKHSPTEFSAKVMAKVGPVKANFAGDVTLSDLNPPHSYLISGKGTGGAAGFAEGGAEVRLEEFEGKTRLVYDVDAKVGGKLAQIGSRLIDSTARKMADDFFNRFAEVVTDAEPQAGAVPEVRTAPDPPAVAAGGAVPAASKTSARKAPAKKAAAKKAAARKPAAATPGNGAKPASGSNRRRKAEQPSEFVAGPAAAPPPSLMPEAAIAASATPPERPRQPGSQPPATANNVWWLVGAGIAALLIILVLANV